MEGSLKRVDARGLWGLCNVMIWTSWTMKRSFFPNLRAGVLAGVAVAGLLTLSMGAEAQTAAPSDPPAQVTPGVVSEPTMGAATKKDEAKGKGKDEKVIQSKDTKKELRKEKKANPLSGVDAKLPDKQLFDKATEATRKGHFDVARLDLQTLLNTYPDSQYQMQAKLAIADSWYREGGTAALTQAESEYADFRVFFPNAPEAAEAQMRIGDIYFRQIDKPDRDYAKAVHAEEEYRRMLTDYPDSTLVPAAKQRLREVQEVLATREAEIGGYYSAKNNWPATIARYQTVVDTYPQFSHMDDVLVGLGDAYESEAKYVRTLKLPEAGKARLEQTYDGLAAAAYRKVVLEHSAAAHVEDAKDRLVAMNLPIPTPTPEQIAASNALESSRGQYRLVDRVGLLLLRKADTVTAARAGDPPLTDARATFAPDVTKQIIADFNSAMNPNAAAVAPKPVATDANVAAPADAPAVAAAPLQFQEVPTADSAAGSNSAVMTAVPTNSGTGASGNSAGIEIVSPSTAPARVAPGSDVVPTSTPAPAADVNGGLKPVGPTNNTLPAIEKAAASPDATNEVTAATPAGQAAKANGKKAKPEFDKGDESSSKHKKKKGIAKLNPF
jgi:outer membrane protein assembly factor BamD